MSNRTLINGLAIQEAVTADGLPRVVQANDGSTHVMYLADGAYIAQSMGAAEWMSTHGALPIDPTQAEIDAALAAKAAAAQRATSDAAALRQQILGRVQSAAGKQVDALTAGERNALIVALLWRAGALNPDLTVRPLADWIDRR